MTEEEGRDDWSDANFRDVTWKITPTAFAVAKDMKLFVQTAIAQFPHLLAKRGRPLLHFTAWAGGGGETNTEMEILLDAGVQVNGIFEEERCTKKASKARGAELPGTILLSDRWETVLHAVVDVSLNSKCSKGSTLFGKIVREDLDVPTDDYLWMLNHGGKITSEALDTKNHFDHP
ncbi:hypothetical protein Asppvi_010936 [Aspergillus pseudoviridinutans]|uniref:Uncharacterized protein n=1 Tax=Aspergillus pseudoviridinutans TaxID=1517512 RepID=A0A9P3EXH8_9EURO|nr:uncharacterized protein Asppvi_010936 [Aspergillus pseudoviridinutans]GIJ91961.1 hypothetical protein Asppvi_010936 [Aspergillus pseudoviridinutans]